MCMISYMVGKFENRTTISGTLANFVMHMRRNGQNSTSGQFFNATFESFMGCFLFYYEFWWRLLQDLCVF